MMFSFTTTDRGFPSSATLDYQSHSISAIKGADCNLMKNITDTTNGNDIYKYNYNYIYQRIWYYNPSTHQIYCSIYIYIYICYTCIFPTEPIIFLFVSFSSLVTGHPSRSLRQATGGWARRGWRNWRKMGSALWMWPKPWKTDGRPASGMGCLGPPQPVMGLLIKPYCLFGKGTGWGPPVISWFITPSKYYKLL